MPNNTIQVPATVQGTAQSVLNGGDLVLSVNGGALAFAENCKVTTTAELGQRLTKERAGAKWKEQYVKSYAEQITADQFVMTDGSSGAPSYDQLKALQLAGEPVTVHYSLREGDTRTGKVACGYVGRYLITQLELTGQAGEDAKGSVTLQNSGPVEKVGNGLSSQATKYTMTFIKHNGTTTTAQYEVGEAISYPAATPGYQWPNDRLMYMPAQNFSVNEIEEIPIG